MSTDNQLQRNTIDFNSVKNASLILRTLNNRFCQRIFDLLEQNQELTVTEIYSSLYIEQSVASMHLAKMRRHKIVATKRNGKKILYGLNTERLSEINSVLSVLN